jgi:NTP pyrophosphatase (non-canonical NTP hydrolase)
MTGSFYNSQLKNGISSLMSVLQYEINKLYLERGYNSSPQTLFLGATEELGELAMALLLTECSDFKPSPKKMSPEWADARDPAREIGDLITYLLALCNKLGIAPHFKWMEEGEANADSV